LNIRALLEELEGDSQGSEAGYLYRRLLPETAFDVRLEFVVDGKRHRLVVGDTKGRNAPPIAEMRGLIVVHDQESARLIVELTEPRLGQLFAALIGDLLDAIKALRPDADPVQTVMERLALWRRLFADSVLEGLTPEMQRGLFCELSCLRDFALQCLAPATAVASWVAPQLSPQDFHTSNVAIEVKSRFRKANSSVRISSEEQLDASDRALFLVVYSLDIGDGASLIELVDSLLDSLAGTPIAQLNLSDLLIRYGFLDMHRTLYAAPRYVGTSTCYAVRDGFPRIVPDDLEPGVMRVAYDIDLAACVPFTVSSDEILRVMGGANA